MIFDFILQQIDGNILGPKIIGDTTGISSIWVLFSIFLFGDIWGFAGMLLGVPMFAIMYHWIKNLVFKGLDKNEQTQMSVDYENDFPKKKKSKSNKFPLQNFSFFGNFINFILFIYFQLNVP